MESRLKLVIIFGPPAVGKTTVGYALASRTGFKLLHNHMTIELVLKLFPFEHPRFWKLVGDLRWRIYQEAAASDLSGIILTFVWALDNPDDNAEIEKVTALFAERGAAIHFVELEADQATRLERNEGQSRLEEKPSKRDVGRSRANLLESDARFKLNSGGNFVRPEDYLYIDNTAVSAEEAAELIIDRFGFERLLPADPPPATD